MDPRVPVDSEVPTSQHCAYAAQDGHIHRATSRLKNLTLLFYLGDLFWVQHTVMKDKGMGILKNKCQRKLVDFQWSQPDGRLRSPNRTQVVSCLNSTKREDIYLTDRCAGLFFFLVFLVFLLLLLMVFLGVFCVRGLYGGDSCRQAMTCVIKLNYKGVK